MKAGIDDPRARIHLFDRRFIGFEDSGALIISPRRTSSVAVAGGDRDSTHSERGGFDEGRRRFLDYHRNSVLQRAAR